MNLINSSNRSQTRIRAQTVPRLDSRMHCRSRQTPTVTTGDEHTIFKQHLLSSVAVSPCPLPSFHDVLGKKELAERNCVVGRERFSPSINSPFLALLGHMLLPPHIHSAHNIFVSPGPGFLRISDRPIRRRLPHHHCVSPDSAIQACVQERGHNRPAPRFPPCAHVHPRAPAELPGNHREHSAGATSGRGGLGGIGPTRGHGAGHLAPTPPRWLPYWLSGEAHNAPVTPPQRARRRWLKPRKASRDPKLLAGRASWAPGPPGGGGLPAPAFSLRAPSASL